MKIIDLLNKIANGEEVPDKFKYDNLTFKKRWDNSYFDNEGDDLHESLCVDFSNLNDEIEIIEEEKKIPEKLSFILHGDDIAEIPSNKILMNKINEIIDCLNYLKSKGE